MRADSIASHGRTGHVTALSLGSFGRLLKLIGLPPIVIEGLVEVWNLVSRISTRLNIESRISE